MNTGKSTLIAASATGVAVLVVMPAALFGVMMLALTGSFSAFGGCGGDGGPGGGTQQVGNRTWNTEQMTNAATIVGVVGQRKLPKRAAVIAVSTAIVESDLINVHHGDRDSLGLFQQRPSMGWGSPEQVTNPVYATNTFLDHLVALDGWYRMPPGVAQQKVQRSAFPGRYAPAEKPAAGLVARFWTGPDNPPPSAGGEQAAQFAGYTRTTRCPDQGGASVPLDPAKLPPDYRLPADPKQRAAVSYALSKLGASYVWGAKGPNAFDCSGLMQAAWAHAGVPIPAGTYGQVDAGHAVGSLRQLQPGDLVFIPGSMGSPANPRHVGMYAGNGLIVNAYSSETGVILQPLADWAADVVVIRRVAEPTIPAPPPAIGQGSPQA